MYKVTSMIMTPKEEHRNIKRKASIVIFEELVRYIASKRDDTRPTE